MDYFGKPCMQVIVNDVTERIRLEKELALQHKLRQQQITEVVLGAQERERFELGQELHDNINQILATSKLYLDVAIEEKEPRIELLAKSRNNISMAIEEIRKLSKDLIVPSLNDLGLTQSIKELIRSIQSVGKMKIRLNISGLDEDALCRSRRSIFTGSSRSSSIIFWKACGGGYGRHRVEQGAGAGAAAADG